MLVVFYATEKNRATQNLCNSLEKYGYNYVQIGYGKKWRGFVDGKIQDLFNFLKHEYYHDIICVIDGYDVLACGPPDELLLKFRQFRHPIICGGEKFCSSYNGTKIRKYRDISSWSSRKHINGGFVMGYKKNILHMYKWVISYAKTHGINDDQKILGIYTNIFPKKVDVDIYQNIVFNTITSIDTHNFHVNNKRIITPYKTMPNFVHFPSSISDNHDRYNTYGRIILGLKFKALYDISFHRNIFSCFPLFLSVIIYTILNMGCILPIKYNVIIIILLLVFLQSKISI